MVSRRLAVLMVGTILCGPHGAEAGIPIPPPPKALWEAIVLTEAAGEPFECQVGVAEVLRNRSWNHRGFAGIRRKDLRQFLSRQPTWVHAQVKKALRAAQQGSDLTRQATHFENVEAFGLPRWARRMERTARLGRLTFFREQSVHRG